MEEPGKRRTQTIYVSSGDSPRQGWSRGPLRDQARIATSEICVHSQNEGTKGSISLSENTDFKEAWKGFSE